MKLETTDVTVIGAGPSGTTVAALLHQAGWNVVILEKETFPRFSIGESLLPQCMTVLEEAGLLNDLNAHAESLGFQKKNGAVFRRADECSSFDFTQKSCEGPGTTFEVKRADFDNLLAESVSELGVDIRYAHKVLDIDADSTKPILTVLNSNQSRYQIQSRFILDASGFGRVLPRLLDLEAPSSFPVRQSVFCHIKDNIVSSEYDREKILIVIHPKKKDIWYWLIPFSDGTASVGVVGKREYFDDTKSTEELFKEFISQEPNLRELLNDSEMVTDTRTICGYSADVKSLTGPNYLLLGNAGEFLDPVFSSGVTIAMKSSSLAAKCVDKYLRDEAVCFQTEFAEPLKEGVECFKSFVELWYEGGLHDIFFYEDQDAHIKKMICSVLAGYAWDEKNPYASMSRKRLNVLAELCAN